MNPDSIEKSPNRSKQKSPLRASSPGREIPKSPISNYITKIMPVKWDDLNKSKHEKVDHAARDPTFFGFRFNEKLKEEEAKAPIINKKIEAVLEKNEEFLRK